VETEDGQAHTKTYMRKTVHSLAKIATALECGLDDIVEKK